MTHKVIIPAAKYVSPELRVEFGHIPPLLLPVNGKVLIHHYAELYDGYEIYVGAHEGIELVRQYVKKARLNVKIIDVGKTASLGETVLGVLDELSLDENSKAIIKLGDTLISDSIPNELKNEIYVAKVDDAWRWTVLNCSDNELNFIDKQNVTGEFLAVVGYFTFDNVLLLKDCLKIANQRPFTTQDVFFQALKHYHEFGNLNIVQLSDHKWIDLGHLDKWYDAANKAREFNETKIDLVKGQITKTSENKDKFIDEILWYKNLPNTLQYIIPRVFEYSVDYNNPYIVMEFYGYSTLSECFIANNLDLSEWQLIFERLKIVLDEFRLNENTTINLSEARYNMYVTKTKKRLTEFIESWDEYTVKSINGEEVCSLQEALLLIEEIYFDVESIVKDKLPINACIMHGDFCFSNILFDFKNGIVRLIDPRGSFKEQSIYGDSLYDLAKLSHSVRGQYDFIVREQFYFEQCGENVEFEVYSFEKHQEIQVLFESFFLQADELKLYIDFLEATLFLSMLPLHSDSKYRQKGLMATGLLKFTRVMNEVKQMQKLVM